MVTRSSDYLQSSVTSEFAINTTPNQQTLDYLIQLPNSNIIIIWESYLEDGSSWGVYAKIISNTGQVIIPQFRVNQYTTNSQSFAKYSLFPNGSFLIGWESTGQDGDNLGIYAQVYDINTNVVRSEFRVNTNITNE